MRLTLRTLLAYLDDILEAPEARDLGAKINESEMARGLIERIRDVLRKRRLTAPDIDGPGAGLDPNTVAEYLDNTLSPQAVADVERVCLESDLQLAEVAACHQILTLVLGDPVQVPPESRERLYALIPRVQPPEPAPPPVPVGAGVHHNGQSAAVAATAGNFADTIPDYLRPNPAWKRAVPYAAVALLAAAWLGLLLFDPTLFGLVGEDAPERKPGDQVAATNGQGASGVPEGDAQGKDGDGQPQPNEPDQVADATGANVLPPINPPPLDEVAPGEPVVDAEPPAPLDLPVDPVPPPQDNGDEPVVANLPQPPAVQDRPMPPPVQPVAEHPAAQVAYASREGLLLRHDPVADGWFFTPYGVAIAPGTLVASPDPFQAVFGVGEKGQQAMVRFAGGTAARWLGGSEAGTFGFEIQRGGVAIESPAAAADAEAPPAETTFGLVIGNDAFRVALQPGTLCGIEVEPKQPDGFQNIPGPSWFLATLSVARGRVTISDAAGWSQTVEGPQWLSLSPGNRPVPAEGEAAMAAIQPLPVVPGWIDPEATPPSFATTQMGLQFEKRFDKEHAMLLSVPDIAKDNRPQVAELAIRCLVVTESMPDLVDLLAYEALAEEARKAAIVGLRTWLARHPDQAENFQAALDRSFRSDTSGIVAELLWGYSAQDAKDPNVAQRLVGWLEHPHVAVRELAIWQLTRHTGHKYDFRATDPESRRRTAVGKWRTFLERNGSLAPMGAQ